MKENDMNRQQTAPAGPTRRQFLAGAAPAVAAAAATLSPKDLLAQQAAEWLRMFQNPDGGWGETCGSYDDPNTKGVGPSTPSQTAWAVMGLLAANDTRSDSVARGITYLLKTQRKDGTWDELFYTGTGFPRVFYLMYHLYRDYFPLIALTTYKKVVGEKG